MNFQTIMTTLAVLGTGSLAGCQPKTGATEVPSGVDAGHMGADGSAPMDAEALPSVDDVDADAAAPTSAETDVATEVSTIAPSSAAATDAEAPTLESATTVLASEETAEEPKPLAAEPDKPAAASKSPTKSVTKKSASKSRSKSKSKSSAKKDSAEGACGEGTCV